MNVTIASLQYNRSIKRGQQKNAQTPTSNILYALVRNGHDLDL